MKKNVLLFLLISTISCQKHNVTENKTVVTNNAKISGDYIGTYKGILPCADCQGLETEIAINENSTFSIKTKYEGKGDKVFVQKGHFLWNKKGDIIILKDVKNGPNQYLVGENTLTQLDMSGNKITGNLADDYILSKQPLDTTDLETVEESKNATVDLNSRIATTTVIEKVNPAIGKFTLAETKWKLISLNSKKVLQKGDNVYYLKLNSKDGNFSAYSGCNDIGGKYVMPSSSTLTFSGIISTKMACAEMVLESHFFTMLSETKSYKLESKNLTLYNSEKKAIAKFEAIK
ncbi:MAG TPA: copper resistance protein NlpE N-terminal domain-containing protein [Flavobacterium sp.]|uniref:copper resistance protein NlpE N-terminal domain-containing protein n=1 Tax=Flavobacterium sp. TaxID=239 RepID=UPI002BFB47D7|nr:copper resistance protein NlpE N-terminal domain-containing protein [Flavobacterium sp.]HNP32763.1 copper resistance protein NlpE N-terminal domain-containing protein [Flavobacterium sp.]